MCPENRDPLISSYQFRRPLFLSLALLLWLEFPGHSSMAVGKAFSLSHGVWCMLWVFHKCPSLGWDIFFLHRIFWCFVSFFSFGHEKMFDIAKSFSAPFVMFNVFLISFRGLFMTDCLRLNHTCIPGVNVTWTFDTFLLIKLANILKDFFLYIYKAFGASLSFLVMSLLVSVIPTLWNKLESILSPLLFERFW